MAFIRHPKDFFAGLIFIAFGLAAIIIGSNYALGSAARMGPGYFPRILGITSAGSRRRAFAARAEDQGRRASALALEADAHRPGLCHRLRRARQLHRPGTGDDRTRVRLRSAASHEFRPREALVSGVLLATLAVGVFIFGLNLQLPTWPWSN